MVTPRRLFPASAPVDLAAWSDEPDDRLRARLAGASDVAIARALPTVPAEAAARVLRVLPSDRAGRLFQHLPAGESALLLPLVPPDLAVRLFRKLQRDEQADVVPLLEDDVRERLLAKLPPEDRRELKILLKYPPDHLASIMTVNVPTFREDWTVDATVRTLREHAEDEDLTVHYVYVVDEFDRLVGVVSLREILNLRGDRRLGDVCHRELTVLQTTMEPEEASRTALATPWRSVPVVDPDGRLAGVLTDEDATAFLNLETTEDFQRFGGMEPVDSPYLRTSLGMLLRKRAGWLFVLFLAQITTSYILAHFEAELSTMVALAFFLPALVATGGNVGSQSSSLLVRAIALGEVTPGHAMKVAMKEASTGLGLGLIMGVLAFVRVETGGGPFLLSLVVAASIVLVCLIAAIVGGLLPLIVDRLGGDPAVMSAPFITTLVDAIGITLYMVLAVAVLGL